MTLELLSHLEASYGAMEERLSITQGAPSLAEAVHFGSNRTKPIHRWFHFKEGFSSDIFSALGFDTRPLCEEGTTFLDPFCGCGTTLVAGDLQCGWRAKRVGVEVNPFLAFVARTKVSWRGYDPTRLAALVSSVLATPLSEDFSAASPPPLSSFHNPEMFAPNRLSALLDAVRRTSETQEPERDLLLLGIAAAAERVSFYRKDGRALRILRAAGELAERNSLSVEDVLRRQWAMMIEDLELVQDDSRARVPNSGTVIAGDGRRVPLPGDLGVTSGSVSLITYSPPYLNHIDYTEVYKVELWLLGFVTNQQEMLEARRQTLRSHASIGVVPTYPDLPADVQRSLEIASTALNNSATPWHRGFGRLALAYLADMQMAMERQYELLRPGAYSICVVANSAHGTKGQRVPVAVDLFLAGIANKSGFEVCEIRVARQTRRRDRVNRYLRESVIILRRPINM